MMYVYENLNPKPINKPGPLFGVITKYMTKCGFPIAEREPSAFAGLNDFRPVPAVPGMVVIDALYGYNLYQIDINGDAHALNVKVSPVEHEFVPEKEIETDHMAGAVPHPERMTT
jgi:hypothetical protein